MLLTMISTTRLNMSAILSRNTRNSLKLCQSSSKWHAISSVSQSETRNAWLFVDSVFPIQLAAWDPRHYIGFFREESLLADLRSRLQTIKTHDFDILSLESHQKDGGVFIHFSYCANDPDSAVQTIINELREEAAKHGGLPSWLGLGGGDVWLVKGTPWREDMNRFATPIVSVTFEGPDVEEQSLYQLFRPYGCIRDLTSPTSVPSGTLRSSTITFKRLRAATIARNVTYGHTVSLDPRASNERNTRLRTAYQRPVRAHAIRDWMSKHPKIVLPMLVFLLGTLTYTIFNPVRSLMVQGKMLDWFDYQKLELYKWLRTNTVGRLSITSYATGNSIIPPSTGEVWRERREAVDAMKAYLTDMPSTITFIHGPQGSGKTRMLQTVLKEFDRKSLVIDCRELQKAASDSQLIEALARQVGYWPVFTFLNSVNNLIDLASVGLIGQKTGLSSSLSDQLLQILNVVGVALQGVSSLHRSAIRRQARNHEYEAIRQADELRQKDEIRRGTWHDGRLDCVAGNGIMSELGIGDELFDERDATGPMRYNDFGLHHERQEETLRRERTVEDGESVASLPIVVMRNYSTKVGSGREELLDVLAQWAAMLAENQIAHVIVISDNRENSRLLAKALPSKALNSVAFSDADSLNSLLFVKQKLKDAKFDMNFTPGQTAYIERLGGRASDLDSLIHRVRSGQRVEEAVEDIINKEVAELRKNAFGDDINDAKGLPWSREQAWVVLRLLSKADEVPYYNVLLNFPFKGDETSLRSMEHAELIAVTTHDGRASTIRPGKPVFRWVFERLVNDPIFQATQDIALNEKMIAGSEGTVRTCEEELATLKGILALERQEWWKFGFGKKSSSMRTRYLFDKMLAAEKRIEMLEKTNAELRKVLAKGH